MNKINNERIYLDLHALQTVPPSNLNRDDTGSPKTAKFGGVVRSRVSSQSWKKAMRTYFVNSGIDENVGIRSLNIVEYLAKEITNIDTSKSMEDAMAQARDTFKNLGISTKDNKLQALLFVSKKQIHELAKASCDGVTDKKQLKEILNTKQAIDIALFGRMVANDASINEDASAQVAHAISTHEVQTEFDFFTATDDLKAEVESGAGMLGTVEFNSSTLYRYANLNIHELKRQLEENAKQIMDTIKIYVEAFIKSMPTGKVNTFANQTLPEAILVVCRNDRPVNLVNAFENPVKAKNGYMEESIQRLQSEYDKTKKFVDEPIFTLTINMNELGTNVNNIQNLLTKLEDEINKILF